jgi:hypothetical protein
MLWPVLAFCAFAVKRNPNESKGAVLRWMTSLSESQAHETESQTRTPGEAKGFFLFVCVFLLVALSLVCSVDHRSAPDTFQVLGKGKMHESSRWGNEPDPDSGLVVGVQYSVNKDKRWEGLRDLKKVAEGWDTDSMLMCFVTQFLSAGETIGDRPIIVVEKVDGDRSAEKQKMQGSMFFFVFWLISFYFLATLVRDEIEAARKGNCLCFSVFV